MTDLVINYSDDKNTYQVTAVPRGGSSDALDLDVRSTPLGGGNMSEQKFEATSVVVTNGVLQGSISPLPFDNGDVRFQLIAPTGFELIVEHLWIGNKTVSGQLSPAQFTEAQAFITNGPWPKS